MMDDGGMDKKAKKGFVARNLIFIGDFILLVAGPYLRWFNFTDVFHRC
jgi:hypothetical protein